MKLILTFALVLNFTTLFAAGQAITIQADGTEQVYNNSGARGRDGARGHDGYDATCLSVGGAANVSQPSGGAGGAGGQGGDGQNGGAITAYFEDILNLKKIRINGAPGMGGYGGEGGRGGRGCTCPYTSWTVNDPTGTPHTYYCTSGSDGNDGYRGSNGRNGSYGNILLIKGFDPVKPQVPSALIDMSQMEAAPVTLSLNIWNQKKGARSLFKTGSNTSDNYNLFVERKERTIHFKWQADRPLSDFKNYRMSAQFDGTNVKFAYPNGVNVNSEAIEEAGQLTYVIHSVVKSNEYASLALGAISGMGKELALAISDKAKVSANVASSVLFTYYTQENGSYKIRYQTTVPPEAILSSKEGLNIKIGELGIAEEYLKAGLKVYVKATVTRTYQGKSAKLTLAKYDVIRGFAVGSLVQAIVDSKLYNGNQVVGNVLKGDQFIVVSIQGNWVSLKKPDGTAVAGWIDISKLAPVTNE